MSNVRETFHRLEAFYKANAPIDLKALRPPVTAKDLKALEVALPQPYRLPASFIDWLKLHDGAEVVGGKGQPVSLFYITYWEPMSAKEVVDVWETLKVEWGEDQDKAIGDKGIKSEWYNSMWVPVMQDCSSNYLCIDFAPAAGGKMGQLIAVYHDDNRRYLIGASFEEGLAVLVDEHIAEATKAKAKVEAQAADKSVKDAKKAKLPGWLHWLVD